MRRCWVIVPLVAILALAAPAFSASREISKRLLDAIYPSPAAGDPIALRNYVATTFDVARARAPVILLDHAVRVVVAVPSGDSLLVRRYSRPGQLDDSFGVAGRLSLSAGRADVAALLEQSNERLIIVASEVIERRTIDSLEFVRVATVTAIRPDGGTEERFGTNGRFVSVCGSRHGATGRPLAATLAPDDSIYIVCSSPSRMDVLRVPRDGSSEQRGAHGVVMSTEASTQINGTISLLLDGSLVVAVQNESELTIVRSTPSGPSIQTVSRHGDCAPRPLILGGGEVELLECSGNTAQLVRYRTAPAARGTVVTTFALPRGAHVMEVIRDTFGRFVFVGSLDSASGRHLFLARYNSDGTVDSAFHANGVLAVPEGGAGGTSIVGTRGTIVASGVSVRSDSADRVVVVWSKSQQP